MTPRKAETPIRLCCGQRHLSIVCPDGRVMCCMCFERFPITGLATDKKDGQRIDVCRPCWEHDQEAFNAKAQGRVCGGCGQLTPVGTGPPHSGQTPAEARAAMGRPMPGPETEAT